MRLAVAGGTGVVGGYVVRAAQQSGHDVVVISRRTGVDVCSAEGLEAALEGVEVVIDTTNAGTTNGARARAFFTEATRNLQRAASSQGVARLVTLSIVGIERVPGFGYYEAKLAQESVAGEGPLPATIVRATQFYEFAGQILARSRVGLVALMPSMKTQPVAARSVGEVLVTVASDPAPRPRLEVAGPEPIELVELARRVVRRRGQRLLVVPLRIPGRAGKALRGGAILPSPATQIVGPSLSEWLAGDDFDRPR